MHPSRIAVATAAFDQPLKTALQTAADMGADAVQLDARGELRPADLSETGRRQLLHHLAELNLGIASLSLPTRRAFYDLDQLDARLAKTREVMQFAWELKAPLVTLRVGRIPAADSGEYRLLVEVLNDLARHGNRVGAVLAVTPTRDEPQLLARLMGEITQGPVGIDFDPAGFAMNGADAVAAYRELHEL
ncbi:MAG: sugar phosphate isomerase/epimerase family protein, partial [Planctomycetaceae bacterium]